MAGHLAVIGGGPMGRAAARIMARSRAPVRLWVRRPEVREELTEELSGVEVCADLDEATRDAAVVFLAVPADGLLEVANLYGESATGDQVVLLSTRGVGPGFMLPLDMVRARTCVQKIGVLGGPIHARELEDGHSLNAVVASRFPEVAQAIRRLVEGTPIAVHASRDVVGLQVAGTISNVANIARGMAEACGFGNTARAMLLAFGVVDAKHLAVALGASAETFGGLAGLGELIPRPTSPSERHTMLGREGAAGRSVDDALAVVDGRVEGLVATREAKERGAALGVELPLVEAVHRVLFDQAKAKDALDRVLHTGLDLDA